MMVRARHDKPRMNKLARWRLTAQGFTLFAVLHAMYRDEMVYQTSPWPWQWADVGPRNRGFRREEGHESQSGNGK